MFIKQTIQSVIFLFALIFSTISCAEESQTNYIVGVVPQFEARRLHKIWQPILQELEKKTGYHFTLEGSPTIPEFEKEFIAGKFDFVYMNPFHIIVANDKQGYTPLIRDIGRTLHGILVVKKDSSYEKIEDLNNLKVAFPAPNALGASLMIRAAAQELFSTHLDPLYVQTHSSVYLNVLLGLVQAGGGVQKTLNSQPENIRNNLRVIYKTREVAAHPFAAHSRIPEAVRNKVQTAFLAMKNTPESQQLLTQIPIRKIGQASMKDYEPLLSMGLDKYYQNN